MDDKTICINVTLLLAQYIAWALSLIGAFMGGVSFWAKHSRYNGVQAQSESPQVAQKPKERGRMYRSA